jgi:hypothetical protein
MKEVEGVYDPVRNRPLSRYRSDDFSVSRERLAIVWRTKRRWMTGPNDETVLLAEGSPRGKTSLVYAGTLEVVMW